MTLYNIYNESLAIDPLKVIVVNYGIEEESEDENYDEASVIDPLGTGEDEYESEDLNCESDNFEDEQIDILEKDMKVLSKVVEKDIKDTLKDDLEEDLSLDDFSIIKNKFGEIDIITPCKSSEEFDSVSLTEAEKEEMVIKNQGLLHKIVNTFALKSFKSGQYQRDDLVGVGMVGLTKALNSYKKNKDTKFSTYATKCITNEILYFLRKENKHLQTLYIDQPIATDKSGNILSLIDTIEDGSINIEKSVLISESLECLIEVVEKLSFNENYIITHRYGLFGNECKTQKEIAEHLHMSQANISKLETSIMEKIKRILMSKYNIKDLHFK